MTTTLAVIALMSIPFLLALMTGISWWFESPDHQPEDDFK